MKNSQKTSAEGSRNGVVVKLPNGKLANVIQYRGAIIAVGVEKRLMPDEIILAKQLVKDKAMSL